MAVITTASWAHHGEPALQISEALKLALSRNRAPMGGQAESGEAASWRAGQMKTSFVQSAVKRIAWSTLPDSTSLNSRRPGRIGRPAASAEVQVAGRSEF